jgi:hypothetical protein
MNFAKRVLMVAGAVALAAIVGAIVTPKATHAVISTLVQMTNTVSNPGVIEDVSKTSSSIVDLICPTIGVGSDFCQQVLPGGGIAAGGFYIVPANQRLVIASIDIEPCSTILPDLVCISLNNGLGVTRVILARDCGATNNFSFNDQWVVSNAAGTSLQFPTAGIVIDSGCKLYQGDEANFTFLVRGYLTSE